MTRLLAIAGSVAMTLAASSQANAATYVYDFHFDAQGSYAATDVYYTGDKVGADSLSYLKGSVNGFVIDTLVSNGFSYGAAYGLFGNEGQIVSYFFAPDAAIKSVGSYASTYYARRGIGYSNGGTSYSPGSGVLTISLATSAPEPRTWAMLVVGFGAVGAVMRGRRRLPVKFA